MTLPTTVLTMGAIQTEFGGANAISLSEYYKPGSYVNSNQSTSGTDGTAISSSGLIRMGMFRGLTKSATAVWRRPFAAISTTGTTNPGNAYDGTATAFDTSTASRTTIDGYGTATYVSFSGSSPLAGTLYIRGHWACDLVDTGGGGIASIFMELSTNSGASYSVIYNQQPGNAGDGTYSSGAGPVDALYGAALTAVPANIRIRVTGSGTNWAGSSFSGLYIYDIVFVTAT
jgi:hypothetical protein